MNFFKLNSAVTKTSSMTQQSNQHISLWPLVLLATMLLAFGATPLLANPPASTTTVLSLSSNSASAGTPVTLTATVQDGGGSVHPGLVNFCDATATSCSGLAFFGSAQLTAAGTAVLKRPFEIGSHSIIAVFAGTFGEITSTSAAQTLAITGNYSTTTTISGASGSLTATVNYQGKATPASAEAVNFLDTTNGNLSLGTSTLGTLSSVSHGFVPGRSLTAGTLPSAIVSGDFNGDGQADLVIANYVSNSISILLGDGSDNFTAASNSPITVGNGPIALAVGDFDSDGKLDIAVVSQTANTVTILLGDGTGQFQAGSPISVDNGPQSIVIADFDHDGIPDLAVASLYASTITVLIGDGAGSFSPTSASPIAVGGNPTSIAAADFDQDGRQDLVVANSYDSTVTVLIGDGSGAFSPMSGSPFTVGDHPVALALGDFNGDGFADLATVSDTANTVTVLLGDGTTFTPASGTPAGGNGPSTIAVGDFNADGKLDLAIPNSSDGTLTVILGDGNGGFASAPYSPLTNFNSPDSVTVIDANGDGITDLAVGNLNGAVNVGFGTVTQSAAAVLTNATVPGGGSHNIVAGYAGDISYSASTSSTSAVLGTAITTATTLSVSPGSSVAFQDTVQLTATISPTPSANFTAGGTVAFFDGGTQIGSATISNGQAAVSINSLPVGSHSITATYSGDTNFTSSSSSSATLTIVPATISLDLSSGTVQTVLQGRAATFTFNITTPSGTFSSPVTFTVSGLPPGATYTFSPSSFPANSAGGTVTLTVQTTQSLAALTPWYQGGLALGIFLMPLLGTRRIRRATATIGRTGMLMLLTVVLGTLLELSGCGSGAATSGPAPKSYTLTVTATSGSIQQSTNMTLTVQ